MPTGQLRFDVTLVFAVDVNGSQGGGDTCSVVPHLVSLPRVTEARWNLSKNGS